ncbi:hypothetical protein L7F22_055311, partial [Adiantum nelumboides]|nr:hypothetical protein [Adiantum nelumboides]
MRRLLPTALYYSASRASIATPLSFPLLQLGEAERLLPPPPRSVVCRGGHVSLHRPLLARL